MTLEEYEEYEKTTANYLKILEQIRNTIDIYNPEEYRLSVEVKARGKEITIYKDKISDLVRYAYSWDYAEDYIGNQDNYKIIVCGWEE